MNKNPKEVTVIDITIGKVIANLRRTQGLSTPQLADKIGVTHQQLSKYEHGINRISASRLFLIAQALETPISYFYGNEGSYKANSTATLQILIARRIAAIDNPDIIKAFASLLLVIKKEVK